MGNKPKFKTGLKSQGVASDPVSLFMDLKTRSAHVPYLWSHQADMLRDYSRSHNATKDLALELPTGAGKTLVGLLIAEFRRQQKGERVLYLCPTRQLANQVLTHSEEYGIPAKLVLKPHYGHLNDYRMADCIAISTYSSLFNSNPRINDPQVIVMDDAHASEGFIAAPWAVSISRLDNEPLYRDVLRIAEPELDEWVVARFFEEDERSNWQYVDMVPGPTLYRFSSSIRDLLNDHIDSPLFAGRFAWPIVRDHLLACCMFVSWREIVIRPVTPPTETHLPFSNATQRVYMSATLGDGGELERLTGVADIARLPVPEGWDRQGIGRRFFVFPDLSLDAAQIDNAELDAVQLVDRALLLTPNNRESHTVAANLTQRGTLVLTASDIEHSLTPFTTGTGVALVLANRYDGIDLPGDSCRLLVLSGLPVGIGLLEGFLYHRLLVRSVFRDRIRTRFTQGAGRCTRGASDFAVVIASGQDVLDFCTRSEDRTSLHPELQAEIQFGLENSKGFNWNDTKLLVEMFLDRDEEWQDAESEIVALRALATKKADDTLLPLAQSVSDEIAYSSAMWRGDFPYALDRATRVIDRLATADLRSYKAWWCYLGGMAAWLHAAVNNNPQTGERARSLFGLASQNSSVEWFARLAYQMEMTVPKITDVADQWCAENAWRELSRLGFSGEKFERHIARDLADPIGENGSDPFERGLEQLGKFLGFDAHREKAAGAPDGVWLFKDKLGIIFEAKSDETPIDAISYDTVRQANAHQQWVRTNMQVSSDAQLWTVVISPRESISSVARPQSNELFYIQVDDIRSLASEASAALRRVRSSVVGRREGDAMSLDAMAQEFRRSNLRASEILGRLTQTRLDTLAVSAD